MTRSMVHAMGRVLVVAAAVGVPLASASAQRAPSPALDCLPQQIRTLTPAEIGTNWQRYFPDSVAARVRPLIAANDWVVAMDTVIGRSRELLTRMPPADTARYAGELSDLQAAFTRLAFLPNDRQDRFKADTIRPNRWVLSEDATGEIALFPGPDQIPLTDSMPSDRRRALCWPAVAIAEVLTLRGAGSRDRTVRILTELAHRWDSYIDRSYSQLPWEMVLNGLGRSRRTWEPPTAQWVFMHPSVGVEVAGLSRDDLVRLDVAVLEGLGRMWYFKDYSRRIGVTGVATFSSDRAMGLGGYAHLWFPQAKVGYVDHPDSNGRHRGSILVSIDLYDLITGVPTSLREAKDAALALRKKAQ